MNLDGFFGICAKIFLLKPWGRLGNFFPQKSAIFRWLVTILENGNLNAVMRIRIDLDHLGSLLGAPSTEDT